jgi:hypothetical protein
MPITIHCSHCRRMLRLRDEDVGKTVQCPSCGRRFATRLAEDETLPPSAVPDFELSNNNPPPPPGMTSSRDAGMAPRPRVPSAAESEGGTYAVQLDAEALAPPPNRRRKRSASRPRHSEDRDDEEADVQPHRGVLILVLGILSIILACIPLAGWILGGISMSMGSHDQRLMDAQVMDRSGRAMTKAGQVCGIIGVFLSSVTFILNVSYTVSRLKH